MASPYHHSALEGLGFRPAGGWNTESGASVLDYVRGGTANNGTPIYHHISVAEHPERPGQYNAYYQAMHDNAEPFEEGVHDAMRRHGEVEDPIKEIGEHYLGVAKYLRNRPAPPLARVTPENVHELAQRAPMVRLNSASDEPLDRDVHEALAGGDNPEFDYMGRDGSPETDRYEVHYAHPEDPYEQYGFTVRHMPSNSPVEVEDTLAGKPVSDEPGAELHPPIHTPYTRPFSYNVTNYPTDQTPDDEDYPVGEFEDVLGEHGPHVANFRSADDLLAHHDMMLKKLKLRPLPPPEVKPWQFSASVRDRSIMERADEDLRLRRN